MSEISVISEIHAQKHLTAQSKQLAQLAPELDDLAETPARNTADLLIEGNHGGEKVDQLEEMLPHVFVPFPAAVQFGYTCLKRFERRIDLPALPLVENLLEGFPHVLRRRKMVAPVAQNVRHFYDPPGLKLMQTRAYIRARNGEGFCNIFRIQRFRGEIQESVH